MTPLSAETVKPGSANPKKSHAVSETVGPSDGVKQNHDEKCDV